MTHRPPPWRVAVTRDEDADGPLSRALRDAGFEPVSCSVAEELPPVNSAALTNVANNLEQFDWVVVASQRAVRAVTVARGRSWPHGVRTAAVGDRTAAALVAAGVDPAPVVAEEGGAEALWETLESRDHWLHRRVLLPVVGTGRRAIIDGLMRAGARVTIVEAYRMQPRPADAVAADWRVQRPDAAVIASPSAASLLAAAIGRDALASLHAVVAIGATTAAALRDLGLVASVSPTLSFVSVAHHLASVRDARHAANG